jgi:hypothetical protein
MKRFKSIAVITAVFIGLILTSWLSAGGVREGYVCGGAPTIVFTDSVSVDSTVVDSTITRPAGEDHGWDDLKSVVLDVLLQLATAPGNIVIGP